MIDMDAAAALIAAQFPSEVRRNGWVASNLSVSPSMLPPDEGSLIWSVDCVGPIEIIEDEHRFVGQSAPAWTWRVGTGSHGTLHALTPEALAAEVDRWLRTVGAKR